MLRERSPCCFCPSLGFVSRRSRLASLTCSCRERRIILCSGVRTRRILISVKILIRIAAACAAATSRTRCSTTASSGLSESNSVSSARLLSRTRSLITARSALFCSRIDRICSRCSGVRLSWRIRCGPQDAGQSFAAEFFVQSTREAIAAENSLVAEVDLPDLLPAF